MATYSWPCQSAWFADSSWHAQEYYAKHAARHAHVYMGMAPKDLSPEPYCGIRARIVGVASTVSVFPSRMIWSLMVLPGVAALRASVKS